MKDPNSVSTSAAGGGAAGTQYADGAARGTATGNLCMVDDGVNIQSMKGDSSGRPLVTIDTALPAGTNVIGHVIVDSGAITETNSAAIKTAVEKIDDIVSGAGANITQLGGVNVSMNTGVRDTGTQRVTIATDDLVPITGSVTVSGLTNTQYTEDVAAATDPVGTGLNLVRDDNRVGGLTNQNGDNVAARGTNAGELYVKHVDPITVQGAVQVAGDRVPMQQLETGEQTTHDTNLARVLGTQPLLDSSNRLPVVPYGTVGTISQRPVTGEQNTYDTALNPVVAALLALTQSLTTTQRTQAPSDIRLRVQQEMADIAARAQEQQVITAMQTEWDLLENQDYILNASQSVNGGAVGYSLSQGMSGMSCYLMQEVR